MSADTPTWKETISLDETNKIRLSLGLKPLSDSGPSKTSDALAEENFQKRKDQEAKEKEAASLKARIDKARNTLDRGRKLVGVGLGADEMEGIKLEEGEPGEADAKAWVKKQKKRAKELAAKRAKEIEEMDKRFEEEGLPKYGEDDLKGIKVLHEEEEFEEGKETILTLKDSRVLDDEGESSWSIRCRSFADPRCASQTTNSTTSTSRRTPRPPKLSRSRRRDVSPGPTRATTTTSSRAASARSVAC